MVSPKARRTGGKRYEYVDFKETELKEELIAIYKKESEKQRLRTKYAKENKTEIKSTVPLWGKGDIEMAETLGILCPEKKKADGPDQHKTLRECFSEGFTFADLFAIELVEIARSHIHVNQLVEQICSDADLKREAEDLHNQLDKLGNNLLKISPGIFHGSSVLDNALNNLVDDMLIWSGCLKRRGEHIKLRTDSRRKKKQSKPGAQEIKSQVARDLVYQILRILNKYQVNITASGSKEFGDILYPSSTLQIVTKILRASGFSQSQDTFKRYIQELKKEHFS